MNGPQLEDGFTRYANELLEALVVMTPILSGDGAAIAHIVGRLTYGYQRKTCDLTLPDLVDALGKPKPTVHRWLSEVIDKHVVIRHEATPGVYRLSLNKHYIEWSGFPDTWAPIFHRWNGVPLMEQRSIYEMERSTDGICVPQVERDAPKDRVVVDDGRPLKKVDKESKKRKNNKPVESEPSTPKTPTDSELVFAHWVKVMDKPRAKLGKKRKDRLKARFKERYTVQDLCDAIDGCAITPYNMGDNRQNKRFDDLELICRDDAHVDTFIATLVERKRKSNSSTTSKRASEGRNNTAIETPPPTRGGNGSAEAMAVWAPVVDVLREKLPEPSMSRWIDPLRCELDGDVLVLRARDGFDVEYTESNFGKLIRHYAGRDVRMEP